MPTEISYGIITAFILTHGCFIIYLVTNQLKWIDVCWGLGICSFALFGLVEHELLREDPRFQISMCIIIWGIRLAGYLTLRCINREIEDNRYVELKEKWKSNEKTSVYFKIVFNNFALITCIGMCISSLYQHTFSKDPLWYNLGLFIWCMGFWIEAIADRQLYTFKANPANKNKKLTTGIWKTKNANYLGEIMLWWGIAIMALPKVVFPLILAPIIITSIIIFLTGPITVKRLERKD